MGTELYDSPNIFIRELIQNAYDACKMRAEISEKYDEAFIPKIIITYSAQNLTLTISDNGIGIDESVFENYLITIGKSFYKSKSFQSSNFKFSPISNFGIGITSCFMVSDSIEIESTKFYSPLETPKPIHYILNINDKYTEKRQSKKHTFGTVITLQLKNDYASKLEGEALLNIINQNMSYQQIPITLNINNETHQLNKTAISIPNEYKVINNILFFEIENQEWIEGNIVIYQSQHQSIIGNGKISQQCFTITQNSNQMAIGPVWLRFCEFNINISPPRTLQLKANRNKIIENENYHFLKTFLLEFLIDKFDSNHYINTLPSFLSSKPFYFSGNEKEFEFLTRRISFHSFHSNSVHSISLTQIAKKYKGKKIALLHREYFTTPELLTKCAFLFKKYELILIQDDYVDFLYGFLYPYVEEDNLIVTGVSGLVYREFLLSNEMIPNVNDYIQKRAIPNQTKYRGLDDKTIIYKGNKEQLFCAIGNNQYNNIDLQYNKKHKLARLLLDKADSSYVRRFTGSFDSNLAMALENKTQLKLYHNFNGQHYFSQSNHDSFPIRCINIITKSFITTLNGWWSNLG